MTSAFLCALALSVVEPCAPPPPRPSPEPEVATAYTAVGEEELAAGRRDSALEAFRAALERAPDDERARAGFQAACGEPPERPDPLAEALRLLEAEDWEGALRALDAAPRANDASLSLLAGICQYQLGRRDEARRLFLAARAEPALASAADLYLGLIALQAGDGPMAFRHLSQVSSGDAGLSAAVAELSRAARRDGRVTLVVSLEAGYDGNADLVPDGAEAVASSRDGVGGVEAVALARPLGPSGPFARGRGSYRKLLRLSDFDTGVADGAIGYRHSGPRRSAALAYGYDFTWVGRAPHRAAHRLEASAHHAAGPLLVGGAYVARLQQLFDAELAGYSGLRHSAALFVEWPRDRLSLLAGYRLERDLAADPGFRYLEHGPRVGARLNASSTVSLELEAGAFGRWHDERDPWLGLVRSDRRLEGALLASYELADRWTLQAQLTARRAVSNAEAFTHSRVAASVALVYSAGLL